MDTQQAKTCFALIVAIVSALLITPSTAFAYKVYSPIVTPDETAVEFWGDATGESTSSGAKKPEYKRGHVELRHTFFDRLDLGIWMVAESGAGGTSAGGEGAESMGYSRTKVSALYQITDKGAHFVDAGIYLDYQKFKDSLPNDDFLNVSLLFEKDFGGYVLNFSPGIRKQMTAGMEIPEVATYAAGFKYRYHELFNPGFEAYGISLGQWGNFAPSSEQQQNAGPAFYGELKDFYGYKIGYQGAILFPLTTNSATIASGVLEIKF